MHRRGYYTSFYSKWVFLRVVCELLQNGQETNPMVIIGEKNEILIIVFLISMLWVLLIIPADLIILCDIPLCDVTHCCYMQAWDES